MSTQHFGKIYYVPLSFVYNSFVTNHRNVKMGIYRDNNPENLKMNTVSFGIRYLAKFQNTRNWDFSQK